MLAAGYAKSHAHVLVRLQRFLADDKKSTALHSLVSARDRPSILYYLLVAPAAEPLLVMHPGWQLSQYDCPSALWYLPASHDAQTVCPCCA